MNEKLLPFMVSRGLIPGAGRKMRLPFLGVLASCIGMASGMPSAFAVDGLKGEYFNNATLAGLPTVTKLDATVDNNWITAAPTAGINADNFSIRWTGSVLAQHSETYTFYTRSDDGVRLWVNGQQVINNWTAHSSTENSGTIALEAGKRYNIVLEFYEAGGNAEIRLLWSSSSVAKQAIPAVSLSPVSVNGLKAEYYNNKELTGAPLVTRVDNIVDNNWASASPVPGAIGIDNFGVVWTGTVKPEFTESYSFFTRSDDGVRLWVDGQLLVDNWTLHSSAENTGTILLQAGKSYNVQMEFFENGGSAEARLLWSSTSQAKVAIPMARLSPQCAWDNQDVGGVGTAGTLAQNALDGIFTVNGAGTIASNEDRYQLVHQPLYGDGEITARVVSQTHASGSTNLPASAAAGIVIRDTSGVASGLSTGVFASVGNGVVIRERLSSGGSGIVRAGVTTASATPIWLKLVRAGGLVTSYSSTDGVNWVQEANSVIPLPTRTVVGLAAYTNSGTAGLLNRAVFDNVTVLQGLTPSGDADTDGDGATDLEEAQMGTNPSLANSPNNASGGVASDGDVLRSLRSISTSIVTANAYEKENTNARIRINRSIGTMPLTVSIGRAGNTDGVKGSASTNDYTLKDAAGATIGGTTITIPAGATDYDVQIAPVVESPAVHEVPEMLRLTFQITSSAGTTQFGETRAVHVRDATNTDANRKLFVAYYGREGGAVTTATGVSTLLMNGDNTIGLVNSTFSNLTSAQSASHLHAAPAGDPQASGPIIESIPLGQVNEHSWVVTSEPGVGYTTDQATLNALVNGFIYINVHSANYASGEIRGNYALATGSITPPPTPAAPPAYGSTQWPTLAGEDLDRDISRFLTQATFGPTPESIQEVKDLITANGNNVIAGYTAWLNKQIDAAQTPSPSFVRLIQAADVEDFVLRGNKHITAFNDPQFGNGSFGWNTTTRTWTPSTIHQNNYPNQANMRREWWTLALQSKAQLRQRMAHALSQIVVVSEIDTTVGAYHYGLANYYDMLADGAFGRYRDILGNVTNHPIMGIYLSHLKNRKASGTITPDENYAREIMQLFSIGLVLRHPDGSLVLNNQGLPISTYDQEDIRELARVMTGLSFGKRNANVLNAPTYPTASTQAIGVVETNTNFTLGNGVRYWQAQWMNPMKMFDLYHDFGAKTLFNGKVGQTLIPVRTDNAATESEGQADVELAVNALAGLPGTGTYAGHPNTPIFISRLLIQRFTTSNPSSGYLYRVANVYKNTNGNLGEVVKAILLDYEARSLSFANNTASAGKPKEPILHYTAYLRATKAYTGAPLAQLSTMAVPFTATESPITEAYPATELAKFVPNAQRFRFFDMTGSIVQSPLRAPSVFNWFLPDYVMPGPLGAAGLVAPELQISTESNLVNVINNQYNTIFTGLPSPTNPNTGRGLDDFPLMAQYQNATGVQLSNPQYGVDAGYFTSTTFDASPTGTQQPGNITNQKDNMQVTYDTLIAQYTTAYTDSLTAQYAPAVVPAAPGTTQKQVAHDAAVKAIVDQQDLLFAGGYLKAKFGSLTTANPRKAIIDAVNLIAVNNRHTTDAVNFANDARTRIRNIIYLVVSSPQSIVQK